MGLAEANAGVQGSTMTIADIRKELISVKRCMGRFLENGDIKRLVKLRARLDQIQDMIDQMQKEDAERVAPKFRKSYGYGLWCDSIASGCANKNYL